MSLLCVWRRLPGVLQRGAAAGQHSSSVRLRTSSDHREHRRQSSGDQRHRLPATAHRRQRDRRATLGRRKATVWYTRLVVLAGADSMGHGGHVPPLLQMAGHGAP